MWFRVRKVPQNDLKTDEKFKKFHYKFLQILGDIRNILWHYVSRSSLQSNELNELSLDWG